MRVAVLGITPDEASAVVSETPGWLELSVVNSRSSVAVSGETDAVAAVVATVAGRGSFAKEIEMWFPAHTTALDSARAELESLLPPGQFDESPVQFIGSATAADKIFSPHAIDNIVALQGDYDVRCRRSNNLVRQRRSDESRRLTEAVQLI